MAVRASRRRFLGAVTGLGAGVVLAACQQAPPAQPTPQVVEKVVEKVVTQVVERERVVEKPVEVTKVVQVQVTPQAAPVDLVYWDWWQKNTPQQKQWWEWVEKELTTAYPNVKLQFQNVPFGEFMTKILTAYAGGAPPDAMASSVDWGATLWDKGALRDLNDYVRTSKLIRMDNYARSSVEFVTSKGHTFGLPASGPDSYMFIANTDLLAEKEVDLTKITTYDALKEAAVKLTQKEGGKVSRAGFLLGQVDALDKFYTWILTNGSPLYDGKQSRTLFNTPEHREKTLETFRLLLDLQYTSAVSLPFEAGRDTTALLSQKKAAIVEGGNWNLPRYAELFPDLKLDVVLYPAGPKGQRPTTHTWTNMQVLPANTKNPDWGWRWIELHSSTPSLLKRMEIMGEIGPPLDLFKSPQFAALVKRVPPMGRVPAIIEAGQAFDYRKYKEVEKAIVPHVEAMMLQKLDPAKALAEAEAAANPILIAD